MNLPNKESTHSAHHAGFDLFWYTRTIRAKTLLTVQEVARLFRLHIGCKCSHCLLKCWTICNFEVCNNCFGCRRVTGF